MTLLLILRGGAYHRVADPSWERPLDGGYSMERGGRWNPPNRFPVVYLNASIETARANVALRFEGRPFAPEDLDPNEAPVLVETQLENARFVDVVTDGGCTAAGLPTTYPLDDSGQLIPWTRCQPLGQRAWDEEHPGLVCRSAAGSASDGAEELAWFERAERLIVTTVTPFEDWFW